MYYGSKSEVLNGYAYMTKKGKTISYYNNKYGGSGVPSTEVEKIEKLRSDLAKQVKKRSDMPERWSWYSEPRDERYKVIFGTTDAYDRKRQTFWDTIVTSQEDDWENYRLIPHIPGINDQMTPLEMVRDWRDDITDGEEPYVYLFYDYLLNTIKIGPLLAGKIIYNIILKYLTHYKKEEE